jgi:hypothetical protein
MKKISAFVLLFLFFAVGTEESFIKSSAEEDFKLMLASSGYKEVETIGKGGLSYNAFEKEGLEGNPTRVCVTCNAVGDFLLLQIFLPQSVDIQEKKRLLSSIYRIIMKKKDRATSEWDHKLYLDFCDYWNIIGGFLEKGISQRIQYGSLYTNFEKGDGESRDDILLRKKWGE